MTRRHWVRLAACAPAAGCGRKPPFDPLPETLGEWHRTAVYHLALSQAPEPIPPNSVDRIHSATYQGPGKIHARVYRLTSPAVALEVAQHWRPSADTVFFNSGRYFAVVTWEQGDRAALRAFVQELEKRLKPKA